MKRKSSVEGSAQYVLPAIALAPLLAFTSPLGLLAYPFLVACAKKGIAEDLDEKHLEADQTIANTWDHSRPHENHIQISDTEFCDGIFPFSATRVHEFTRNTPTITHLDTEESRINDLYRRCPFISQQLAEDLVRYGLDDV